MKELGLLTILTAVLECPVAGAKESYRERGGVGGERPGGGDGGGKDGRCGSLGCRLDRHTPATAARPGAS
eukprot:g35020.t1